MAKGDWWIKFEIHTWLNDPKVRRLSRANRDSWLTALCMMRLDGSDRVTGTQPQMSHLLGLTLTEFFDFYHDLEMSGAADVTRCHDESRNCLEVFTIMSRRFRKELTTKEKNKLRKAKARSHADVTPESQDRVISKKKEVIKEKKDVAETAVPAPKKKPLLPESDHKRGMEILQQVIGKYPDGGGQAKALKWMLESGATLDQIERELKLQHAEYSARGIRASFLSLQKTIFTTKAAPASSPDIMSRDYPGADHVPFGLAMDIFPDIVTVEGYEEFKAEWVSKNQEKYHNEVAEYECSRDFRERFGEAGSVANGSTPTGSGSNGNGKASATVPVP